jgi:hypothetical protein
MAFEWYGTVPELVDLSKEPNKTFDLYGEEAKKPGTFANVALTARRLVERGVRFAEVDHNWTRTVMWPVDCPQVKDVDQACYGVDHRPQSPRYVG